VVLAWPLALKLTLVAPSVPAEVASVAVWPPSCGRIATWAAAVQAGGDRDVLATQPTLAEGRLSS
jgi:hypothetical protein